MHPPLERLSTILRALEDGATDRTRMEALLAVMAWEPFEGAGLFAASPDGLAFLLLASHGADPRALRSWKRWPLRRLFARMKPARIADPAGSNTFALAVPFVHGARSYVVVAPVRGNMLTPQNERFFEALESITIPRVENPTPILDEIPIGPLEPSIVGLSLCPSLESRVRALLLARGWALTEAFSSARSFYGRVAEIAPDLVVVDGDELANPANTLRLVNRATQATLQILTFRSAPAAYKVDALSDCTLPHDAEDLQIFAALKKLVRKIGPTRAADSRRVAASDNQDLHGLDAPEDLARFAAVRAAETVGGWAGVALVSESGTVHLAEYPRRKFPILSRIPPGFLLDRPLFQLHVDGRLIDEVADENGARADLMSLQPVSGAVIPIEGRRRIGVITAVSMVRAADSEVFEELVQLGRGLGKRYQQIADRRSLIPEFARAGRWERWSAKALDVAVYRSHDCAIPWRYHALSAARGLLTLGDIDGARVCRSLADAFEPESADVTPTLARCVAGPQQFAAVLDSEAKSIVYAAHDFSPPLVLGARGPSGVIDAGARVTTGVAALGPTAEAVVCDRRLWQWFGESGTTLRRLPSLLDERTPPGMALLITLGS